MKMHRRSSDAYALSLCLSFLEQGPLIVDESAFLETISAWLCGLLLSCSPGNNPYTLVWGLEGNCLVYACGVLVVVLNLDSADSKSGTSPKQRFLQVRLSM